MDTDIYARTAHLPGSIKGFSRQNPDGSITVIINEDLDMWERIKTFEHEMEHIISDDFNSDMSADHIEAVRHAI